METKCPHCRKAIEVLSPAEMQEKYGLNSNKRMYAKEKGRFPEPWLSLGGSPKPDLYLKSDIDDYMHGLSKRNAEKGMEMMKAFLDTLSPEEAEGALAELTKRSGGK
jgi:hypothetical protein